MKIKRSYPDKSKKKMIKKALIPELIPGNAGYSPPDSGAGVERVDEGGTEEKESSGAEYDMSQTSGDELKQFFKTDDFLSAVGMLESLNAPLGISGFSTMKQAWYAYINSIEDLMAPPPPQSIPVSDDPSDDIAKVIEVYEGVNKMHPLLQKIFENSLNAESEPTEEQVEEWIKEYLQEEGPPSPPEKGEMTFSSIRREIDILTKLAAGDDDEEEWTKLGGENIDPNHFPVL